VKRSTMKPRKKPMRQRSARRADTYAREGGRREIVSRILGAFSRCQRCKFADAVDVHEVLPRSAGGSILDEDNLRAVCRTCHRWIHEHPKEATASGWLVSRYSVDTRKRAP
jgi:5-methylcytosine-specific restriction endonuclease McrA